MPPLSKTQNKTERFDLNGSGQVQPSCSGAKTFIFYKFLYIVPIFLSLFLFSAVYLGNQSADFACPNPRFVLVCALRASTFVVFCFFLGGGGGAASVVVVPSGRLATGRCRRFLLRGQPITATHTHTHRHRHTCRHIQTMDMTEHHNDTVYRFTQLIEKKLSGKKIQQSMPPTDSILFFINFSFQKANL